MKQFILIGLGLVELVVNLAVEAIYKVQIDSSALGLG